MISTKYFHVDVFATRSLTGNGLAVFTGTDEWSSSLMQTLTREMRQMESIFLSEIGATSATARIFTEEEELPFAGHPVLGAAAVLHRIQHRASLARTWTLRLPSREVAVTTKRNGSAFRAEMDQGEATVNPALDIADLQPVLQRLGLRFDDMAQGLPAQVVSTGLPYLIIPLRADSLARAAIHGLDLEHLLSTLGAKFLLLFDVAAREVRSWDNLGRIEDVATGSAAGPAAAYLFLHGLANPVMPMEIAQGRYAGRPSRISVRQDARGRLFVSGEVWPVAHGTLDVELE